jgi:rhodanese-related sulfurtransferase
MGSDDIDPAELARRIDEGRAPIVIDTRSTLEFNAGHVPGAVHVPFWSVPWRGGQVAAKPGDEVVVYCGHGPRAMMAALALKRFGFQRIRLLRGHWAGWRKARLKVEG